MDETRHLKCNYVELWYRLENQYMKLPGQLVKREIVGMNVAVSTGDDLMLTEKLSPNRFGLLVHNATKRYRKG